MKACTKCQIEKDLTEFYPRTNRKGTLYSECKTCMVARTSADFKKKKQLSIEYLGNKCQDCQTQYHPAVYQFHHLDPQSKDYDWGQLRKFPFDRIKLELDKCVLLCANCHVMRHAT